MINDTRAFPSTKRKGHMTSQNIPMKLSMCRLESLVNVEESLEYTVSQAKPEMDDKFAENPKMEPAACACIRLSTKLQNPKSWKDIAQVRKLTIEDEQNFVKSIPEEIYSLGKLRVLSIRWSGLKFISSRLEVMQLTHLDLSNNKLQTIDSVANMKSLTTLNLSVNCLRTLPENIGNLTLLQELNLSGNQLSHLPMSFSDLRLLSHLELTSNNMTSLPSAIGSLQELRIFDVSLNKLTSLPDEIGSLETLTTLILSHNHLSTLPDTFKGATQLRWLFLRKNNFTEVQAVLFALPNLTVLNMNDNSISSIPASSTNLKHLMLNNNKLGSIPDNILACENLQTLCLECNAIQNVPEDIRRLSRLRMLHLGGNDFEILPSDVGELKELRDLSLKDNRIKHLPTQMGSLRRLSNLNLDNTCIDGGWMSAYRQGVPGIREYARNIQLRSISESTNSSITLETSALQSGETNGVSREEEHSSDGTQISEANNLTDEIPLPQGTPVMLKLHRQGSPAVKKEVVIRNSTKPTKSLRRSSAEPLKSSITLRKETTSLPVFMRHSHDGSSNSTRGQASRFSGIRRSDPAYPTIVIKTPTASPSAVRKSISNGSATVLNQA